MHGGNLRWAAESYGPGDFIDLSANINPFGPPEGVWKEIRERLPEITHYPDPDCMALRKEFEQVLQIPYQNIMVGNGAGELIFTLLQTLRPQRVVIPVPAFAEYERAARAIGAEIVKVPLGERGWRSFSEQGRLEDKVDFIEVWEQVLVGADVLFLCSPHNPTGSALTREYFHVLLELAKARGCLIIFDESFCDFLPEAIRWSARDYVKDYPSLIVLYSLTKFYSLPGLRLGAVFAGQEILKKMNDFRFPFTLGLNLIYGAHLDCPRHFVNCLGISPCWSYL